MEIDLLYIADCPNRRVARDHLDLALTRTQVAARVHEREVTSEEEATRLGMRGSPTILIDGRDPFADPAAPTGPACRLYQSGQLASGAPTLEQLVEALGR
jgi:hypothetical protein